MREGYLKIFDGIFFKFDERDFNVWLRDKLGYFLVKFMSFSFM